MGDAPRALGVKAARCARPTSLQTARAISPPPRTRVFCCRASPPRAPRRRALSAATAVARTQTLYVARGVQCSKRSGRTVGPSPADDCAPALAQPSSTPRAKAATAEFRCDFRAPPSGSSCDARRHETRRIIIRVMRPRRPHKGTKNPGASRARARAQQSSARRRARGGRVPLRQPRARQAPPFAPRDPAPRPPSPPSRSCRSISYSSRGRRRRSTAITPPCPPPPSRR